MDFCKVFKNVGALVTSGSCDSFYSSLRFKPKQMQCFDALIHGNDLIAVLPTGYGKSLIFQLLPWILP